MPNIPQPNDASPEFTVNPDAADWMREHTRRYLDSNGADGHDWTPPNGQGSYPTLLLLTIGRRSGTARTLPLIYGAAADAYVIIASKGGAPAHPAWYRNLDANPEVWLQVRDKRTAATVRTATGDEREQLWKQLAAIYPPYDDYAARAAPREIPVVVRDPHD